MQAIALSGTIVILIVGILGATQQGGIAAWCLRSSCCQCQQPDKMVLTLAGPQHGAAAGAIRQDRCMDEENAGEHRAPLLCRASDAAPRDQERHQVEGQHGRAVKVVDCPYSLKFHFQMQVFLRCKSSLELVFNVRTASIAANTVQTLALQLLCVGTIVFMLSDSSQIRCEDTALHSAPSALQHTRDRHTHPSYHKSLMKILI